MKTMSAFPPSPCLGSCPGAVRARSRQQRSLLTRCALNQRSRVMLQTSG